jgi:NitT/TauT family transport system substrate-binding protein
MNRRRSLSLLGALGLPLVGASVVRAQPLEKIRVIAPPSEDYTGMYYAVRSGMLQKAGFDVEMSASNSGVAGLTAVIAGDYELCRTNLISIMSAHLHGVDVVIVLPANVHNSRSPMALLQVAADSPIKTGADLNGKTVAVPSVGDLNTIAMRAWVDKNGGDWRSVKYVEIPNSAQEAALVQRRVDAAVLQSPQVFVSIANGTSRTLGDAWSAIAPRFFAGVYVARADWAAAHQAALKRFTPPYIEAQVYVNGHPAETAALASEITKVDLATVLKMRRQSYGTFVDPALIQPVIDTAYTYEAIARRFPAREIIA